VSGLVNAVFVYISSLKMEALLSNCTVVEQRAVIFLWPEGTKISEMCMRMLAQYGKNCMA
jgi:hypothetical protein